MPHQAIIYQITRLAVKKNLKNWIMRIAGKHENGAYTESISIGPEIIQILLLYPQKRFLLLSSLSRPVQPDIVNVNLTQTAWHCHIALSAQANRNPVYVG